MTTGFSDFDLPPPSDWQKFERLCRDLWAAIWNDPDTQLNGRSGQKQAGVDVFGRRQGEDHYSGVQCKRRDDCTDSAEISETELRAEVAKAKSFKPPLKGKFILAFTGKRDAKIQEVARTITAEQRAEGSFEVVVYSWNDICEALGSWPEVWAKHYGQLVATVSALTAQLPPTAALDPRSTPPTAHLIPKAPDLVLSNAVLSPLDVEHKAEIDLVRTALREKQPQVALLQAEALRNRIWAASTGEVRAKLLVLLALAKLELGEYQAGARQLIEAGTHAPNEGSVQAYVAYGHLLADNPVASRSWAEKALAQNPTDIIAVQVSILHDSRPDDEVLAGHEAVLGKRAEVYACLGHRAARRGEPSAAYRLFEQSLALDRTNIEAIAAAGQTLVDATSADVDSSLGDPDEVKAWLRRGLSLLDEAIGKLPPQIPRKQHLDWYLARVFAKHLMRSPDLIESAERLLQDFPGEPAAVWLRAVVAFEMRDYRLANTLGESLPEPREPDCLGMLATAKAKLGELAAAENLWAALLARNDISENVRHDANKNYVLSLHFQNRNDEATGAVEALLASNPRSLSHLLIAAD